MFKLNLVLCFDNVVSRLRWAEEHVALTVVAPAVGVHETLLHMCYVSIPELEVVL